MQSVHCPSVYRTVPSTQYKPQQGCSAHHIIWMLLNTFYMFKLELIFFPGGSGGSTTAQWCGLLSSSNQGFQVTPQIGSSCMVVTAWWWIVLPIHIIWIVSLTTCNMCLQPESMVNGLVRCLESSQDSSCILKSWSSNAVVKAWRCILLFIHIILILSNNIFMSCVLLITIPDESTSSTTAQWHGMMPSSNPGFQQTPPICTNSCSGSGKVMDCSAHLHHMNVVKHLAYIWCGYENHAMWVCSLNCTMVWYDAQQWLKISTNSPNLYQQLRW